MALIEGCKHALDVLIPVEDVSSETTRVVEDFQKRVRLPGFRPGKAPAALIRKNFAEDVRQKVLEALIPKALQKEFENLNLRVVGSPNVTDVHFLTITTQGDAAAFFSEVANEVEMNPPDIAGVVRVAASHDIEFVV